MSKDNTDAETQKELSSSQALEAMFASSGWQVAEEELLSLISQLRDVRNIPINDDVALNIKVNLAVAENLEIWLDDLKGRVDNAIIVEKETNEQNLIVRRG